MERREFLKKSAILGGACAFCAGAGYYSNKIFPDIFGDVKNSRFYIDSDDKLPKCVRFDLSSYCNLRCPVCARFVIPKSEFEKMPQGNLKFDKFKEFLDKSPFLERISLSSSGELFMNPELDKMLEYAYEKGLEVYMRGGAHLNHVREETLENLVKYGVKILTVSIDGATPETYKIYRVGGDFNTVIENVKIINKYKKQYNSEYPELEYKFVVFGHNEHEIEAAKKLAAKLNMTIRFDTNYDPSYSPLKNPERVKELTGLNLNYKENLYDVFASGNYPWFPCMEIVQSPMININGELHYCCKYLLKSNTGINVIEKGLRNALNDPKIIRLKEVLTDFSKDPKGTPCNNCEIYEMIKQFNVPMKFL